MRAFSRRSFALGIGTSRFEAHGRAKQVNLCSGSATKLTKFPAKVIELSGSSLQQNHRMACRIAWQGRRTVR